MESIERLDRLNVALMLGSCLLACLWPIETFLFSFAVLGPLHYVTEISWLKDRNFFLPHRLDKWWLLAAVAIVLLTSELLSSTTLRIGYTPAIFLTFFTCLIFVSCDQWVKRFALLCLLPGALVVLIASSAWLLFSLYLVTFVHVYIFTGAFLLSGAIKYGNRTSWAALGVFALCPLLCCIVPVDWSTAAGSWALNAYSETAGPLSTATLENLVDQPILSTHQLADTPIGIMFVRVLAFAYTYHYLNWFSKTSIIKWHKVRSGRLIGVIVIWIISVALYAYDFALGYKWLFALSLGHVILEFPLNHQVFLQIGRAVKSSLIAGRRPGSHG